MPYKRTIIITGGAGFIGSHVVRLFVRKYPEYHIINLDKLTYAGNLANLKDIEDKPNYSFIKADICDYETVKRVISENKVDGIIHLAAESHVDRSITDPFVFAKTNVLGTLTLLQAARECWEPEGWEGKRFYHISTDEVYGALELTRPEGDPDGNECGGGPYGEDFFTEENKYQPHSPYSAAKASSDHFVRAYHDTYGMPTIVTNCSNNYGPYQFPEKLIPLFINNIRNRKPLPVYGKGENVRDWLYVEDHARAIDLIFHKGEIAQTYNIGGFNEWKNIDLIKVLIRTTDRLLGRPEGSSVEYIIRRNMYQGCPPFPGHPGEVACRSAVYEHGHLRVVLGLVHVGVGCAVDYHVYPLRLADYPYGFDVGDVEVDGFHARQ